MDISAGVLCRGCNLCVDSMTRIRALNTSRTAEPCFGFEPAALADTHGCKRISTDTLRGRPPVAPSPAKTSITGIGDSAGFVSPATGFTRDFTPGFTVELPSAASGNIFILKKHNVSILQEPLHDWEK